MHALGAGVLVALLTVYLIWGSTYLAIRVVVTNGVPPLLGMGLRFLVAGALLAGVLAVRRGPGALRISRAQLLTSAVVGTLLLFGGNGFVAVAEQTVPSWIAALLVSTTPLWLVVLGLLTGDRPRAVSIAGTLVGFAGTAVLARPGGSGGVAWWGVGVILLATLCWASGSLFSRRRPDPADAFVASAYQMLIGGAVVTESVFVIPGLGRLTIDAILRRDYPVIQGVVVLFSFLYVLVNLLVDLVYTLLDPRIRY